MKEYICKNCGNNLQEGIGIRTETNRVYTKQGYDHETEYSVVKGYFCPKCLKTVRRKLGEEIYKDLRLKG